VLRRSFRLGLKLGILAGLALVVAKALGSRRGAEPVTGSVTPLPREAWPPLERDPVPSEPTPSTALHADPEAPQPPAARADVTVAFVEPTGDVCPTTHPVKAKLSSKIFHVPGGQMYDRTKPDRCYRDAGTAESDGLRQAKR
jgi:hypothetical protein